jgi:phytoene synthase
MTATLTPTLSDAYEHCESVTRAEAKNFSYGIRLLPADQRRALSAVYALSRRIDDIGDGELPKAEKVVLLEGVRTDVNALDVSSDPVLVAVADVARRFPIPVQAFAELVDGVEMDVCGTSYDSFEELVVYCRRVAGTIGRLCLGIYGTRDPADLARASALADDLGVALQQTNILRDVREDLLGGRIYVPGEDLRRYEVTLAIGADGVLGGPATSLASLIRASALRADDWYARGLRLLELLDRRSRACTAAMAGIYVRLNSRLAASPEAMTTGRIALSGGEKARVAARALVRGRT